MSDVPPPPQPPTPPPPPQPPVPPVPPPPPGPGGPGYAAAGGAGEPPLDQPFYGASFGASVRRFFRKYATFSGRASRGEFWWWTLLYVIIAIVFSFFTDHFKPGGGGMTASANVFTTIESLWNLAIIVPFLALSSRRLHDTNRSGWWVLLWLIPIVGTIILIVWWAGRPKPEGARFDR